ncbi:nuclear transport factor 2 family protein [Chryseobacterium culicis]|uniref:SnoaL-like domain-containing protein n=1 Tax=Chryseobacterium culicis TaxID=680127 RepID=A0A2S9CT21_CHRCI|nr:nuclear transport factor 2 family protein [Chryseobacterium culicis]PRB83646.1 hypothetical protein CQ022_16245 [Chryseobacterium culicis]PRB89888.1 hypothetical protein CQ033_15140 [Chryseobacterium culicis]
MNLPNILQEFLEAQKVFDSTSLSRCFSDHATVFDEGKIYKGKEEIRQWNEKSNNEFQTFFEIQIFSTQENTVQLKINISGSFDGSPILLNFYFRIEEDLIAALAITE